MRSWVRVLAFLSVISGTCYADDFFNPPQLNPEIPPWMKNSNAGSETQNQNPDPNSQPNNQAAQPASPESAPPFSSDPGSGMEGSDDEETPPPFDFESGSSDGGGGSRDQGKTNFQVLDQMDSSSQQECIGWGSAFLGTKVFPNQTACRNELDQEIENARDSINNYTDATEKEVLRGVIKGKIPREKSKDFHLEFSSLKGALTSAAKSGCTCLE